ncbi:hypothetical protein BM607_009985 [Shewanella sp. SACH]|nr:hypothetical protein BM607_009985 [Shewanella sp. SACH]
MILIKAFKIRNTLWNNSVLAERTAKGVAEIGIVATVTVGDMVAYSHPCDRDISMSYTADVAVEPIGILF